MITEDTVFIVGAGGSMPYGFPVGSKLRENITSHVNFNLFHRLLVNSYHENETINEIEREIEKFRKEFKLSNISSIDNFLSSHPSYLPLGKKTIILHLLEGEKISKFGEDSYMRDSDWYFYLYNEMISGLHFKDGYKQFGDNKLSILTFNYDRSFEEFLFQSLTHSYEGIKESEIIEQIKKISIIHLHGTLGPLHWQENGIDNEVLNYGKELNYRQLRSFEKNINIENEPTIQPNVSAILHKAKKIFFLGFGFGITNLETLNFPNFIDVNQKIYASTLGIGINPVRRLKDRIISSVLSKHKSDFPSFEKNLYFDHRNCLQLLQEYL